MENTTNTTYYNNIVIINRTMQAMVDQLNQIKNQSLMQTRGGQAQGHLPLERFQWEEMGIPNHIPGTVCLMLTHQTQPETQQLQSTITREVPPTPQIYRQSQTNYITKPPYLQPTQPIIRQFSAHGFFSKTISIFLYLGGRGLLSTRKETYLVGYFNKVTIAHSMVNSNSDEEFKEVQQQLISVTKLREEKTFEIVALKKSKQANKPIHEETRDQSGQ